MCSWNPSIQASSYQWSMIFSSRVCTVVYLSETCVRWDRAPQRSCSRALFLGPYIPGLPRLPIPMLLGPWGCRRPAKKALFDFRSIFGLFSQIQTPTAKQDGGPFQSSGIKLGSTGGCSGHPVSVLCSWFGLVGWWECWGARWSW